MVAHECGTYKQVVNVRVVLCSCSATLLEASAGTFQLIFGFSQILDAIKSDQQAMVFVHSRKDTVKTARILVKRCLCFVLCGGSYIYSWSTLLFVEAGLFSNEVVRFSQFSSMAPNKS